MTQTDELTQEFSLVRFGGDKAKADAVYAYVPSSVAPLSAADICRNCEPLTPEDIGEVIVFAAGRPENVVIADTLIYPSHQVSCHTDLASLSAIG